MLRMWRSFRRAGGEALKALAANPLESMTRNHCSCASSDGLGPPVSAESRLSRQGLFVNL